MSALGALVVVLLCATGVQSTKRNVLHIIVDDLRPELGAYGLQNRHTPNIDKIAINGITFDRAYCQQAVCGELLITESFFLPSSSCCQRTPGNFLSTD